MLNIILSSLFIIFLLGSIYSMSSSAAQNATSSSADSSNSTSTTNGDPSSESQNVTSSSSSGSEGNSTSFPASDSDSADEQGSAGSDPTNSSSTNYANSTSSSNATSTESSSNSTNGTSTGSNQTSSESATQQPQNNTSSQAQNSTSSMTSNTNTTSSDVAGQNSTETFVPDTSNSTANSVTDLLAQIANSTQPEIPAKLPSLEPPSDGSVLNDRGADYEIWQNQDGTYTARLGVNEWVYNDAADGYVPHTIRNYGNNVIDVRSGLISWRIMPQEASIYGGDFADHRATEKWLLSIGNVELDKFFISQTVIDNATGVFVTNKYETLYGNSTIAVDIVYAIRDGDPTERIVIIQGLPETVANLVRINREWTGLDADVVIADGISDSVATGTKSMTQDGSKSRVEFMKNSGMLVAENLATAGDKLDSIHYDKSLVRFAYDGWTNSDNPIILVDDTYSNNDPTVDGRVSMNDDAGSSCPTLQELTPTKDFTTINLETGDSTNNNSDCRRGFVEWSTAIIPHGSDVTNTVFKSEVNYIIGDVKTCDIHAMANKPSTASASTLWTDTADGTAYVNAGSWCTTVASNIVIDLGTAADADVESSLGTANWFAIGIKYDNEARNGNPDKTNICNEEVVCSPDPTLEVTYAGIPDPRLESSGEQRITYFNGTANYLFYYDGSNIVYKYSLNNGDTWSAVSSASTGPLAANSFYSVYGEASIVVLTWASSTAIFTKSGNITGSSITWNSTISVTSVSGSNSGQRYYPSFEKSGSTLFLGYNVVSGGSNVGNVYSSTNFGKTWTSSTALYSGESNPAAVGIAKYAYSSAVAIVAKYGQSEFQYKTWSGIVWSASTSSTSGAGLSANALKTSAFSITSDDRCAWVGYVPSNSGGALKSMKFCDGPTITFPSTSVTGTNLYPTISSTIYVANTPADPVRRDHVFMYYVRGNAIKEIETVLGAWSAESQPGNFGATVPAFMHASKYTFGTSFHTDLAWREGTTGPSAVHSETLNHGIIMTSGVKNSPSFADYFEGERRVARNIDGTLFAFYYDGSNIMYKRSFDNGYTWTINPTSTGSSTIASDNFRWSLAVTEYNEETRIALLYFQVSGAYLRFYQMTFRALDTGLVLVSTVNTLTVQNGANAAAAGASDQSSTLYAAYRWKVSSSTWRYQILRSTDGGSTWQVSLAATTVATSYQFPITLTSLNNSTKMLFVYSTYEDTNLQYRVYNGQSWSSVTSATAGISANSVKQISSDTVNMHFANGTMTTYVVFLTSGNQGTIKVGKFSETGSFLGLETVSSQYNYWLPSISISGDGSPNIFALANNVVYTIQKNGSGWQAPTSSYSISYSAPDELTSNISDGSFTAAITRSGSASPYNYLYTAQGGLHRWVAVAHDIHYLPTSPIYGAKATCNFDGTDYPTLGKNNVLCQMAVQTQGTCCPDIIAGVLEFASIDWGYTAYTKLTKTGEIQVGGKVFVSCEVQTLVFCSHRPFFPFTQELIFSLEDLTIDANTNDNITLYMEWSGPVENESIPNGEGTVSWYYSINTEDRVFIGKFRTYDSEQFSQFYTGTSTHEVVSDLKAYFFQVGVARSPSIFQFGQWTVTISNPAYIDDLGGSYNNHFDNATVVQGDDAYWDFTARWGGLKFNGVNAEAYECLNSTLYDPGRVTFVHPSANTVQTATKLWGDC
jgi:hypothetical protein